MSQAKMQKTETGELEAPRFEEGKALVLAGFREHYVGETMKNIPAQWQRFAPHIGQVPGQVGPTAYGVCWSASDDSGGIEYLSGVEVSGSAALLNNFTIVAIPALRYVVFPHRGHVSRFWETLDVITRKWFPESGFKPVRGKDEAPDFFERYSEEFNPQTGMGGMEVWVPIARE
jgi:AraC family transcriptional regulator